MEIKIKIKYSCAQCRNPGSTSGISPQRTSTDIGYQSSYWRICWMKQLVTNAVKSVLIRKIGSHTIYHVLA